MFDSNYRPRAWSSPDAARAAIEAFAPMVSVALPTFDDEAPLFGDRDPSETIRRWRAAGATEIVVKLGAEGCMLTDGLTISPTARLVPVDTTGAGDSFNAAYLAARRRALSNADAAAFANTLAGRVIMSRGAILPRSAMSDLVEALASRRGPVAR